MINEPHLCIEGRIFRHHDQVIDGVEPKANGIKRFTGRRLKWKLHSPQLK